MNAMPAILPESLPALDGLGSAMRSAMRESADIAQLACALIQAQTAIANPPCNRSIEVQTANGRAYPFRYATLDRIIETTRSALADARLCVIQPIVATERGPAILTRLLHESGQWLESEVALPAPGRDPQAFGSAVTYLRRYALAALLNVAPNEDDDGNTAAGNHMEDADPAQALAGRARAARSIEDGQALLEAWQQHAAALEQHRGSAAWQAMERELGKGLQRSLGPILSTAFTTALRADDAQHIAALRRKWDGEWAKTLRAVEQQAPAIHAALAQHVAAQAARVRNAQRQPPQEPHGPSGGNAGGDDAPEPGADTPADRSDARMAAHGQDGAPPPH